MTNKRYHFSQTIVKHYQFSLLSIKLAAAMFGSKNILTLVFIINAISAQNLFPLSIVHINDLHAKFEETNSQANSCKNVDECIGGYARVVHMVKELKKTRPNVIYLNAADNFQGTLWYIMFRWNVTQYFLNLLPADVMVPKKVLIKNI